MEQELPKPLVSERINIVMMSFVPNIGDRDAAIRHGEKAIDEARAMEAELQRLRAQVEAMRVAGKELAIELSRLHDGACWQELAKWDASLNPTPTTEAK